MKAQIRKIDIDKWCYGCEIHSDPGVEYILNWIANNAERFREGWEKSRCKECAKWRDCGYELKESCENFEKLNNI